MTRIEPKVTIYKSSVAGARVINLLGNLVPWLLSANVSCRVFRSTLNEPNLNMDLTRRFLQRVTNSKCFGFPDILRPGCQTLTDLQTRVCMTSFLLEESAKSCGRQWISAAYLDRRLAGFCGLFFNRKAARYSTGLSGLQIDIVRHPN